jgi:biopolymer transport protein TolR
MAAGSRHGAEINVTPLIDVLLVLLIIFVVIVPPHNFGEEADIPLPTKIETPQPEPPKTIVLQLHDMGEGKLPALKINQQDVSWDKLEARLQAIF